MIDEGLYVDNSNVLLTAIIFELILFETNSFLIFSKFCTILIKMFKIFFYINELNDIQKENLNQLKNINIIYRNYQKLINFSNAFKLRDYCKKRNLNSIFPMTKS